MAPHTRRITIEETTQINITTSEDALRTNTHIIDRIISWCFYAFIALLPLIFFANLSEPLELAKQSLLFAFTGIIVSLFSVRTLITKTFTVRHSPLYIGFFGILLAWIITSFTSHYPFMSLVGIDNQEFLSLSTITAFLLLTLVGVEHFRTRSIPSLWNALYSSSAIVSVFGILQLFKVYLLPFAFTQSQSFNTIGLVSTWAALAVVSLIIGLVDLLHTAAFSKGRIRLIGLTLFSLLQLGVLVLIDDWRHWIALIIGLLFAVVTILVKIPRSYSVKAWVSVPLGVLAVSVLFLVINLHIISRPIEVNPSLNTSASIAWDTLKSSPVLGWGPGTFRQSYEHFRPASINTVDLMNFWTIRFEQSGSALATTIAATGIIGILALLLLWGIMKWHLGRRLLKDEFSEQYVVLVGSTAACAGLFVLSVFLPANMSLIGMGWLILLSLSLLTAHTYTTYAEEHHHRFTLTASLVSVLIIVGSIITLYYTVIRIQADMAYEKALTLDSQLSANKQKTITKESITTLVDLLTTASDKNPYIDNYQRTLSQALLYKLQILANEAGGAKSLSESDRTPIIEASIAAAQRALGLSAGDVRNTYQLAVLYETLAPIVENTQKEVVQYFERSIELEPNNPTLRYEYALYTMNLAVTAAQTKTDAKNSADQQSAQKTEDTYVAQARTLLQKAIELKENYVLAYFQLARLYARDNNVPETIHMLDVAAQYSAQLLNQNAADFNAMYTVGLAYKELNEYKKADQLFTLIARYNPGNSATLYQLALVKKALNLNDEAKTILQSLLSTDPSNQNYMKALQDLSTSTSPTEPSEGNIPSPTPVK